MTTPTLFGIDITDRASRLVAADVAEERALIELAAALRTTARPLILERTDPPVLVPLKSRWGKQPEAGKPRPWRAVQGKLLHALLAIAEVESFALHFVPAGFNTYEHSRECQRWLLYQHDLTLRTCMVAYRPEEFLVTPGLFLVCTTRSSPDTIYAAHEDVPQFDFDFVPAFPDPIAR